MGRYREEYTVKSERRYDTALWWGLWVFCTLILVYTISTQYSEYRNIKGANSVVAKYYSYNGQESASFMDEDNQYHTFDITGVGAKHDDDSIVLYYKDDINLAEPQIGAATWIRSYAIFGTGFVLLSIKLISIYKKYRSLRAD